MSRDSYLERMPKLSEAQFQEQVIGKRGLACILGWRVSHSRPAMIKDHRSPTGFSWRTAIQGAPGFPDNWLVKEFPAGGRLVVMEMKREGVMPGPEQRIWLDLLLTVEGIEVYLPWPSDLGELQDILTLSHVPNRIEALGFKSAWGNRREQ